LGCSLPAGAWHSPRRGWRRPNFGRTRAGTVGAADAANTAASGGTTDAGETAGIARLGGMAGDGVQRRFHRTTCRRPGSSGPGIRTAPRATNPHPSAGETPTSPCGLRSQRGQKPRRDDRHRAVTHCATRRVRMLLAALMLLTGVLGQAGHAWAHGGGQSQRAWAEAMEAEQAWLAAPILTDGGAESSVQIFTASQGHSHGDSPDNQQDGLATDHAHSVVFLMPPGAATDMPGMPSVRSWPAHIRVPATPSDSPDRPPRTV
jgi:hypothetical protein